MSDHSPVGASGAKRWIACPASVALSEGLPETPESVYAEEGTKAHELAEQWLGRELIENFKSPGLEVSNEMIKHVTVYREFVLKVMQSCAEWPQFLLEEAISIPWIDKELWGTVDFVVYDEARDHMHVFDLKYGEGIMVDAEENPQLLFYATGCYLKFMPKTITSYIIQPRANSGDTIKQWTYDVERIIEFEEELKTALNAVRNYQTAIQEEPLTAENVNPGDHCQFCPAHTVCPKHLETFTNLVEVQQTLTEGYDDTFNVKVMSEEKALISWMKAIREGLEARVLAGEKIEGTKLVRKSTHRQWIDETKFMKKFGKRKTTVMKVMTPAQAEKEFGKEKVAKMIHKPEGQPTLALLDDKRKAIELPALTVFDDTTKE